MRSSRFLPPFTLTPPGPLITDKTLFELLANEELVDDDVVDEAVDADEAARCTVVDDADVAESDDLGRRRVVGQYGSNVEKVWKETRIKYRQIKQKLQQQYKCVQHTYDTSVDIIVL